MKTMSGIEQKLLKKKRKRRLEIRRDGTKTIIWMQLLKNIGQQSRLKSPWPETEKDAAKRAANNMFWILLKLKEG